MEAFAFRNGLPVSYVASFVSAVRATADGSIGGAAADDASRKRQRPQQQSEEEDTELTFTMFRRFVRSREEALRRAFSLFDQGGKAGGELEVGVTREGKNENSQSF